MIERLIAVVGEYVSVCVDNHFISSFQIWRSKTAACKSCGLNHIVETNLPKAAIPFAVRL